MSGPKRNPMTMPHRYGDQEQYRMALHKSADARLKCIDVDGFAYGLGEKAFYEYKHRLDRVPGREWEANAPEKQAAQMSVVKHIANGEYTGAAFHIGYSLDNRKFAFWPLNKEAEARIGRHCPGEITPGTPLWDMYFEAFLYMTRDLPWDQSGAAEYKKVLEQSMDAALHIEPNQTKPVYKRY